MNPILDAPELRSLVGGLVTRIHRQSRHQTARDIVTIFEESDYDMEVPIESIKAMIPEAFRGEFDALDLTTLGSATGQ